MPLLSKSAQVRPKTNKQNKTHFGTKPSSCTWGCGLERVETSKTTDNPDGILLAYTTHRSQIKGQYFEYKFLQTMITLKKGVCTVKKKKNVYKNSRSSFRPRCSVTSQSFSITFLIRGKMWSIPKACNVLDYCYENPNSVVGYIPCVYSLLLSL